MKSHIAVGFRIAAFVALGILVAGLLWHLSKKPPLCRAGDARPVVSEGIPMQFGADGTAGKIAQAVARVAGPGRVRVAVLESVRGRCVCILADEYGRFYEMDQGVSLSDFPAVRRGDFKTPPVPIVRTMSAYRSVAKMAAGYDEARGDRMIVLLCPRPDWDQLGLAWPASWR